MTADRVTGDAHCTICGWRALLTGDDTEEVRADLLSLAGRHINRFHPPEIVTVDDHSHYCDWDMPGTRLVRALCGTLIARRDHQTQPTCPVCLKILADREKSVGP
jgi:hypothetical protein